MKIRKAEIHFSKLRNMLCFCFTKHIFPSLIWSPHPHETMSLDNSLADLGSMSRSMNFPSHISLFYVRSGYWYVFPGLVIAVERTLRCGVWVVFYVRLEVLGVCSGCAMFTPLQVEQYLLYLQRGKFDWFQGRVNNNFRNIKIIPTLCLT